MKNIVLTLALLTSCFSFGQIAPPRQKINLNLPSVPYDSRGNSINIGPPMMLGGVSLFAAGILTPPLMVGGSTTQKQPFYKQGGRALAMVSGALVFTVGVGISIGNM